MIKIKLPKNAILNFVSYLFNQNYGIVNMNAKNVFSLKYYLSRSIATIRLVFSRTIGYYFLRTYFPLIIIVFWWDSLLKILHCIKLQYFLMGRKLKYFFPVPSSLSGWSRLSREGRWLQGEEKKYKTTKLNKKIYFKQNLDTNGWTTH